ncbi:uncharacterized protein PFL1_01826 [Pseudozyma flocculosa PF-1]|uniref:Uncharacterized protein n=1 Tax=Pseudozyma flocculosa TaxID=84751 RepID=A0A5C3EWR1_9BASI|nr:uncharacterized protein PFL1_01826 [Pseudozyma flocculosa PF-1]EPQ30928.1 hypothetical protein PFL1_01826 [Pseudozyma flocculosa PF-1]SPO36684.1 uncharacterized protein PSFLO_02155 [Pseudozyma flocculosa]
MASKIAGKVTRRLVGDHAKRYEPEDPLYEFYTVNGKQKRRKRALPPGLTKKQARTLKKIKRRAHHLDKGFTICGFRFGWTAIVGIVPGLGDITAALLNYTLVVKPAKNEIDDIPDWLVRQLLFNNAVSAGVGLVPIVGDIALAAWRANSRNANLIEEFLRVKGEENMAAGLQDLTPRPPSTDVAAPAQDAVRQQVQQASASSSQTRFSAGR